MNFLYKKTAWGKILDYGIMPFWWLFEVAIFWVFPIGFFAGLLGYGFWPIQTDVFYLLTIGVATFFGILVSRRILLFWPDLLSENIKTEGKVEDCFIKLMGSPQNPRRGGSCEIIIDEKTFHFYADTADQLAHIGQYVEVEHSRFLHNVESVKVVGRSY
jgi:hypothetical protein